ncbi:MAG: hypothetical protein IIA11_00815 [Proteobacteria bacterium]|nr:hypothetical protein [Pseudomonadota bacterium]
MRTIIINKNLHHRNWTYAAIGLLFAMHSHAGNDHRYTISVDASLSEMTVTAHFSTAVTDISARSEDAPQFLVAAYDCDSDEKLETRGRRLVLPDAGINCLNYRVDLREAANIGRHEQILDPANIAVSPTLWMWRPRLAAADEIHVQFRLPDNVQVSVPWQPLDNINNGYRLVASPQSGTGIAIFGAFTSIVVDVAGTALRIAVLNSHNVIDTPAVTEWVRETAGNIALTYGRFPNSSARIVVIPVGQSMWGGDAAVPFGRVVRDGGETIELFINEGRPVSEYYGTWTATHEFSHLLLPYLQRSQRWISEGFAQYYQNLLLARAGQYTESYAWQELFDGFERGRQSAPGASPNAATAEGERGARMKIYWSGAALALIADVELRRRSDGRESLDTVLDRMQQCCLPSARTWSGTDLFRQFDSLLVEPLFMDLYRQYADATGFPDVRPLLEQLGVRAEGGEVRLSDDAELATIRRSLMARKPRTSSRAADRR